MPLDEAELSRRAKVALEFIKRDLGAEAGESMSHLFATHHLDELDAVYWQAQLKTDRPDPAQVLDLLCLRQHWGDDEDDGMDTLDFGLPRDVSDYVLSVRFDEDGEVEYLAMES